MALYNSLDTLTKATYDISNYGEDLFLPITTDTLALQSITWSGLDELLQEESTDLEAYSRLVSDIDTLGILNEGDGVRYDRTFDFLTDMSAWCYKFNLTFAVGLSLTAYTSGNHSVDSVKVTFSETKQIQIVDETDIDPVDPFDPQPPTTTCPAGYHKDFSGKCVADDPVGEIPKDRLIETLKGFLFGTVALSLLARKY